MWTASPTRRTYRRFWISCCHNVAVVAMPRPTRRVWLERDSLCLLGRESLCLLGRESLRLAGTRIPSRPDTPRRTPLSAPRRERAPAISSPLRWPVPLRSQFGFVCWDENPFVCWDENPFSSRRAATNTLVGATPGLSDCEPISAAPACSLAVTVRFVGSRVDGAIRVAYDASP